MYIAVHLTSYAMSTSLEIITQQIEAAINDKAVISCTYKGEPRRLIPLAIGVQKNGRLALFCDLLFPDGSSFRAYKVPEIDGVERLDIAQEPPCKHRVYYQTGQYMNYFKSILAERKDWNLNRKVI